MNKKTLYIVLSVVCGIFLLYFLFSTGNADDSDDLSLKDSDSETSESFSSGLSGKSGESEDYSIFDSDFFANLPDAPHEELKKANPDGDGEPEILESADPNNPLNPNTKQRFTDAMMKRFDQLREKYPNNSVIPRKMTPEEKEEKQRLDQELVDIHQRIVDGSAGEEEINTYYDHRTKQVSDRLELLEHFVGKRRDALSPDMQKKLDGILSSSKKRLDTLELKRKKALERTSG